MKTVRNFTCDALIRLSLANRKASAPKPAATADKRQPVDLNEIHRRFWAKLAGREE